MINHVLLRFRCCLILLLCFLSGCQSEKSVDYFLLHPEEIPLAYSMCSALKQPFDQNKECAAVLQAFPVFQLYLNEVVNNPSEFGMEIMRAEMKLALLEKSYTLALKNKSHNVKQLEALRKTIGSLKLEVQSRLAVIRFISNNH